MITGYNTDIKHSNRVFHVQTEDNGLENPSIVTLIYVGGEILASKKTSYADKLPVEEKAISSMMEDQHRKMIAAIRKGRFDGPTLPADPLADIDDTDVSSGPPMLARTAVPRKTGAVARPTQETTAPVNQSPRPSTQVMPPAPKGEAPKAPVPPVATKPPSVLRTQAAATAPATAPPAPRGKEPTGAIPISDRSLDQVIIDYLANESMSDHLELSAGTIPDVYGGDSVDLRVFAQTAVSRKPIIGAEIVVKIISTIEKPVVAFKGKTTGDGSCSLHFKVPDFRDGNAAIIVTAASPQGNDELKQLVKRRR